ncbi:thiol-disulfide isomerase/thioredoxin [Agromyces ramosus]|uniref:Thiol-disulfide isomerase/thioredoxin n=1 Tax=Agromyces ramosus TaxID=33879 RepID=A0A4Q7MH59_9MICO|nr:thioredoxin family protein [Agromyces ramosus]RZS67645.1 thiol-disulfide isomerase/thioredoxin [Agromyces ramosus]
MDWLPALIAAVALPAGAATIGLAWRARTGRIRATRDESATTALGLDSDALGTAATLVQFSTAYCSRCPSTARQLAAISADYAGVRHVEVDLTDRPDLADRFHVLQTPTTLILDARGEGTARIGGVPRARDLRDRLDILTGSSHATS